MSGPKTSRHDDPTEATGLQFVQYKIHHSESTGYRVTVNGGGGVGGVEHIPPSWIAYVLCYTLRAKTEAGWSVNDRAGAAGLNPGIPHPSLGSNTWCSRQDFTLGFPFYKERKKK